MSARSRSWNLDRGLAAAAIVLALAAWSLPALRLATPVTAPQQWSTWQLALPASAQGSRAQLTLNQRITQLANLDRQWRALAGGAAAPPAADAATGQSPGPGSGWKWSAVRAVPWAVAVAAWAAVLAALGLALRWRGLTMLAAVAGAAGAAYAAVVSPAATALARAELRHALAAARSRWPWTALFSFRMHPPTLAVAIGVWVLLAAFLAVLLLGGGGGSRHRESRGPRVLSSGQSRRGKAAQFSVRLWRAKEGGGSPRQQLRRGPQSRGPQRAAVRVGVERRASGATPRAKRSPGWGPGIPGPARRISGTRGGPGVPNAQRCALGWVAALGPAPSNGKARA